jgi:hypothetical protein
MTKTLHFHFYDAGAYSGETQRWIMCDFFSVIDGRMHVGSSQMVKLEEWPTYRGHIERNGWTQRQPFYGQAAA